MKRAASILTAVAVVALSGLPCWTRPAPAADPFTTAEPGQGLEEPGGSLELVKRDLLISNPGKYRIPDEQLHFPYLFESTNGIWYLTYREGPHLESLWNSAGNRVQCVQSRDGGKTWLPWMGMKVEPWMYQLFVTRLKDGTLIGYRCRMTRVHQLDDGTTEGTAIILRSADEGTKWTRHDALVTNMPFSDDTHLTTLWGHAIVMPDGRLLWGIISRERKPQNSLIGVVESTDGGRTFRYLANLCTDVYGEVGEPREPGLALLPSGELVAAVRCSPMIFVGSSDGGHTWSAPRKLAHAGMCPQLLRLENGVLACSYGTRRYMHVMASWDGRGREWSKPLVIYEGQTGGYSNLQALGPDRFRICYQEGTFDKYQTGGHRIVRLELNATTINK